MSFGLSNARATFQSLMNKDLSFCYEKIFIFIFNDILVYNIDRITHLQHFEIVLLTLQQH